MRREYTDNKKVNKQMVKSIPEQSSLEEVKSITLKSHRKNKAVAFSVLCIIVIVGAFLCYSKLFKIKKLVIPDDCPYTEEQMLKGMGIKIGDTLYGKSNEEINENVKYNLAFIDSLKVSRIWPDTIKVHIEKANPTFYITFENTMYILSQSLRVLSKTNNIEDIELGNLKGVQIDGIKSCVEGEYLVADDNETDILCQLYELLNKYEVFEEITNIDVTDRFNITMSYGTKFEVKLGDRINLEPKIQFMLTIIKEKSKDGSSGIIDVSDDEIKEGTFRSFT